MRGSDSEKEAIRSRNRSATRSAFEGVLPKRPFPILALSEESPPSPRLRSTSATESRISCVTAWRSVGRPGEFTKRWIGSSTQSPPSDPSAVHRRPKR
jgi:hypothetical protein